MRRKGFTLVEVIIAITIFSIAVLLLYRVNETLTLSNASLIKHSASSNEKSDFLQTLRLDFLYSDNNISEIKKGDKFDAINFNSRHSLYDISSPYIEYHVSKDRRLWRLESSVDLNFTITDDKFLFIKFDELAKDITRFKVYDGNGTKLFIIEQNNKDAIVLELTHQGD